MTTTVDLRFGDCLAVLRELPDCSVHAIVCDPPYGLADHKPERIAQAVAAWCSGDREHVPDGRGFMGRAWDGFVPPPAVWDECLRVLTPGGHLLAFAGSRTADLMGLSVRLAGFEIRDTIMWVYGSGMPKGQNVGKAIDARGARNAETVAMLKAELRRVFDASGMTLGELNERCGFEASGYLRTSSTWATLFPSPEKWARMRKVIGSDEQFGEKFRAAEREVIGERTRKATGRMAQGEGGYAFGEEFTDTAPATPEAARWEGWNTSLKPAQEPIIVARKPLAGTVAANVLAHGTGALNIDATRVQMSDADREFIHKTARPNSAGQRHEGDVMNRPAAPTVNVHAAGRWPANVVLVHAEECVDGGGCGDGCPVAELDQQSGTSSSPGTYKRGTVVENHVYGASNERPMQYGHGDSGGASRFFPAFRYQAKAAQSERPKIDGKGWPTVKPLALMRWLVRLVTPLDVDGRPGVVLDPFAGTGSTLQAARDEGFASIGIERDEFAYRLACQRLGLPEVVPAPIELRDPVLLAITAAGSDDELTAIWQECAAKWVDEYTEAVRARLAELSAAA